MRIGFPELIIVFIVALVVIGPDKLPLYARKFGAALREFRSAASDVTSGGTRRRSRSGRPSDPSRKSRTT